MKQTPGILTDVFERITDAFVALDSNWCYTYMNKKAAEIFQRNPVDMIGKHIWTEFPEGIDQSFYKAYYKAMAEQQYIHVEEYYPPYDKWFENHIYPSPSGLSIFFRDITQQKTHTRELELREKHFQALLENNTAIIALTDDASNSIYQSPSSMLITGWTADDMKIKGGINYFHPDDIVIVETAVAEAIKEPGIPQHYLVRYLHKNGHYIWLEGTATKLTEESIVKGIVFNSRDVTEKVELEQLLLKATRLARIGSWDVDLIKQTVYWNEITREIHEEDKSFVPDLPSGLNYYKEGPGRELIRQKVKEAIEMGKPWDEELEIVTAKNNVRWIRTIGETEFVDGKCVKIYGSFQDIDQRKNAEAKLNESVNRYRRLFDTSPIAITEEDHTPFYEKIESLRAAGISKNYATYFDNNSEELYEMLGRVQILGVNQSLLDLTGANNLEDFVANRSKFFVSMTEMTVFKLMDLIRDGGGYFEEETKIKSLSGEIKEVVVRLKYPAAPPYNSVAITMRNVTKQKEFEQKITESEELFRTFSDNIQNLAWIADKDGWIYWYNQRWYDYTGTTFDEMQGWGWEKVHHPDHVNSVVDFVKEAWHKPEPFELIFPLKGADCGYHWFLTRCVPILDAQGKIVRWIGTNTDIHEQKLAQERIEESEAKYRSLVTASSDVVYRMNPDWTVMNQLEGRGFIADTVKPNSNWFQEYIHPNDQAHVMSVIKEAIRTRSIFELEHPVLQVDGTLGWTFSRAIPMFDAKGDIVEWFGAASDITEIKKAAENIREAHQRLTQHLNNTPLAVIEWDKNFIIRNWSPQSENIFGWSESEVVNKHFNDFNLVFEEDAADVGIIGTELMTGEVEQNNIINRNNTKAGNVIYCQWFNSVLKDEQGNVTSILSLIKDITERKKSELILAGEKKVMEMIATEKSLEEILNTIALNYESYSDHAICSIQLLNDEGTHIRHVAGPNLPDAYNKGIEGEPIGPVAGSCGTSAYRKERVIVSDIATDPLWVNYRDFALSFGLKAAWSTPIINTEGKVYGTFAIYYKECRTPEETDLVLIDRSANQVKIVLERYYKDTQIKESEEKYRTLVEQASDAIFIADPTGQLITVNTSACKLSQHSEKELLQMSIYDFAVMDDIQKNPFHFDELKQGKTVFTERVMKEKNGVLLNVDITAKLLSDGRLLVFVRDITKRKKTEEDLKKFNERFEMIARTTNDGLWEWNLETGELWANQTHQHLYGLDVSDPVPTEKVWEQKIHPADREKVIATKKKAIETDTKIWTSEYRFETKNGYVDIYDRCYIIRNADGKAIRATGTMMDITERKKAEETLKNSEEKRRLMMNAAMDGIIFSNTIGEITYWNPAAEKIFGWKSEEVMGRTMAEIIIPQQYRKMHEKGMENYLKNGTGPILNKLSELSAIDHNGREFPVELTVLPIKQAGEEFFCAFIRDITERKKAESDLRENENYLRTILNAEPECVKILNHKGELQYMNPAGLAIIEADNEQQVLGRRMIDLVNENYRIGFNRLNKEVFKGNSGTFEFELTGLKGRHRFMETHAVPLKDAAGKITGLLGVTRDITERKKAEEAITNTEKKFRALIQNSTDGLTVIAADGTVLDMSPSGKKILGYDKNEIIGKTRPDLIHPDDSATVTGAFIDIIKNPETIKLIEYRHKMPDETYKWLECSYNNLLNEPYINAIVLSYRDITERKKAETEIKNTANQLRQLTAHLQTVREEERKRIAREIHDELGQQLTAIKMDLAWMDKKIPDDIKVAEEKIPVKRKFKNLISLVDGSNESVRKILNELRHGILEDNGLLEALEWQGNQFTEVAGVPLKFISSEIKLILPEQIANCLFRLYQESLTNIARHALANKVVTSIYIQDNCIILTVKDDGKGFDIKILQHSKSFGILGMKERVLALKGKFELVSEKNKGTKIEVRLPLT